MDLLTMSVSATDSYALVTVTGEADMTVNAQLGQPLVTAVLAGARDLVVDVSGLRFIDASCVRVLMGARGTAEHAGGTLVLVAPQPVVARMLKLCRADRLMGPCGENHKYPASAG